MEPKIPSPFFTDLCADDAAINISRPSYLLPEKPANGDMPAMPIQPADSEVWSEECDTADGLTKHETMSMHMMAHLMSNENIASYGDQASCVIKAADALLAELERSKTATTQQCLRVLEGWQLVPVEPTIEMISAATHDSVGFGTRAAYQAMLAAAPKPEIKK